MPIHQLVTEVAPLDLDFLQRELAPRLSALTVESALCLVVGTHEVVLGAGAAETVNRVAFPDMATVKAVLGGKARLDTQRERLQVTLGASQALDELCRALDGVASQPASAMAARPFAKATVDEAPRTVLRSTSGARLKGSPIRHAHRPTDALDDEVAQPAMAATSGAATDRVTFVARNLAAWLRQLTAVRG